MLLHEFDPSPIAVINPPDIYKPVEGCPGVAVSCFERGTFGRMVQRLGAEEIALTRCANMEIPVYRAEYRGTPIALYEAYVGAAGCVGMLEDLFAAGVEKLVLFGTCGVLDRSIRDCGIIIPTSALRDEGTSFHYAPPSDEIAVNLKYREEFIEILDRHKCGYTMGKVWTTDAMYRETAEKMVRRKSQGCICVDMECSAVAALAQFRGKAVFQFFHAADNLDGEAWDARSLGGGANITGKDKAALLALELAARIG
ncbi:MAG: nucleoside phosphorylase [Oscillibacter sp.]|nr:nucleoside phosphorylase [Oscillibacter sp.]